MNSCYRHEPPVFGDIEFIGTSPDYLAVSKPPSMPMHPCGAYRHNSLENILSNEPIIENQPELFLVHRLDRYYKGLVAAVAISLLLLLFILQPLNTFSSFLIE